MDLFRNHSLGQFQSLLSTVQSPSKTPNTNSRSGSTQEKQWGSANQHESVEAARSSWNTTRSSLVHFHEVMTRKDQQREPGEPLEECHHQRPDSAKSNKNQQRVARWTNALSRVCSSQISHEKTPRVYSQQNVLLYVCFSKTSSQKIVSRKTSRKQLSLQRNQKFPLQTYTAWTHVPWRLTTTKPKTVMVFRGYWLWLGVNMRISEWGSGLTLSNKFRSHRMSQVLVSHTYSPCAKKAEVEGSESGADLSYIGSYRPVLARNWDPVSNQNKIRLIDAWWVVGWMDSRGEGHIW